MRARTLSLAFLLSTLSLGAVWLTFQPTIIVLLENARKLGQEEVVAEVSQATRFLPMYLLLELILLTALVYAVLYLMVERPLKQAEDAVEQIARMDWEFPAPDGNRSLVSRLQWALNRLSSAFRMEQALTQSQLKSLGAANERLAKMQTELVAAERLASVGRLAAGVAHEVGNPLGGILGYLSLLKGRQSSPDQVADFIQRIESEVVRIDQIVKGLLLLGRPVQGRREPVELRRIIDSSLRLLMAGPDFAEVEIKIEVREGTLVWGDSGPLTQVVLNLALNAAQAMAARGTLVIRSERSGALIHISFEDTGPGIRTEILPQLFEPFVTTKSAGQGTGLGLAVSRHLVTSMGGQLEVTQGHLPGACFTMTLNGVEPEIA